MDDSPNPAPLLLVGDLAVDRRALEIRRDGARLEVPPQAVRVLLALAERPGQLVTREELYDAIWDHRNVDVDRGLNTLIRQLRIGLADSATTPRYIRTYPRRGYRLIAAAPTEPQAQVPGRAPEALSASVTGPDAPVQRIAPRSLRVRQGLAAVAALALAVVAAARWLAPPPPTPDHLAITLSATTPGDTLLVDQLTSDLREVLGAALEGHGAVLVGWSLPAGADLSLVSAAGARLVAAGRLDADQLRFVVIRLPGGDTVARFSSPRAAAASPAQVAAAASRHLAQALGLPDLPREPAVRSWPTGPEALPYLIGRHWLRSPAPEDRSRAVDFLAAAAAAAPSAAVRAHLAEALFWAGRLPAADSQARLALAADSNDGHALFMAGVLSHLVAWDAGRAESLLRRAIARNPARPEYRSALAFLHATAERNAAALSAIDEAYRRDPLSALLVADVGEMALYAGDPASAIRYCRAAANAQVEARAALQCLFEAQLEAGDSTAAGATAQALIRRGGGHLGGAIDHLAGPAAIETLRTRQADLAAQRLRAGAGSSFQAASFLAAAGRRADALAALEHAVGTREPWVVAAAVHPRFRSLKNDPRFGRLLEPVRRGRSGSNAL